MWFAYCWQWTSRIKQDVNCSREISKMAEVWGHVTPNENEYQKICLEEIRYCLGASYPSYVFWSHAYRQRRQSLKSAIFAAFGPPWPWPWPWIGPCRVALIVPYLRTKFRSNQKTRKPWCRKETARCRKCSFLLKFANNIHYKYKTSQASKAATLQSSKHADA